MMLNRSNESVHPCLVPDLSGNGFSFSPLRTILALGLSYMAFIMLNNAVRVDILVLFLILEEML